MKADDAKRYFDGTALIGDDFTPSQIAEWFDDEREAYANLGAVDRASYRYEYHALNHYQAFRYLDTNRRYKHACGFGSAYGDELIPLGDQVDHITLIDSSVKFRSPSFANKRVSFLAAEPTGNINAPDHSFDLITCFGVLHHVPNVTFVVSELVRSLEPGGTFLIREPTITMGDWRYPRPGLTKRERGIPASLLREILVRNGLQIFHRSPCVFPPFARLLSAFGFSPYAHTLTVMVDALLSRLTEWNYSYHRDSLASRFAPSSDFYVCTK